MSQPDLIIEGRWIEFPGTNDMAYEVRGSRPDLGRHCTQLVTSTNWLPLAIQLVSAQLLTIKEPTPP